MNATAYVDLQRLSEDARIELIVQSVMDKGLTLSIAVELDGEKGDRYIAKCKAKNPGIVVLGRMSGPVKGVETIRLGPPAHHN